MVERRELGVTSALTAAVCPSQNDAYRTLAPSHAKRFGEATTLEMVMKKHVLRRPDLFAMTSQAALVDAVRRSARSLPHGWSEYMRDRYGW